MESVLFWCFAAVAVLGALGVVITRNPVRAAMSLVVTLFCLAVIFILLEAHLLATLEVLVYAGAVMVLFLFVIMLLNLQDESGSPRRFTLIKAVGTLAALWLGWELVLPLRNVGLPPSPVPAGYGSVEAIGDLLFKSDLLPFELTSVLLLAAVVGSVMVAKRRI